MGDCAVFCVLPALAEYTKSQVVLAILEPGSLVDSSLVRRRSAWIWKHDVNSATGKKNMSEMTGTIMGE